MILVLELKDAQVCNTTTLRKVSTIVSKKLIRESFKASPQPCDTMKMMIIPEIKQTRDKKIFKIQVNFPVEYKEIRQERVRNTE